MASRYFKQFLYSTNSMLTYIEGSFAVGVNGTVATTAGLWNIPSPIAQNAVGTGVFASSTLSVVRVQTGVYRIRLADNYNRFLGMDVTMTPPASSAAAVDGAGNIITNARPYMIVNASTSTNWVTLGFSPRFTPVPGAVFVPTSGASNIPGSSSALPGSGTLAQIGNTGFDHIEVLGNSNTEMVGTTGQGADVWFQTMKSSSGAPVNPTSGTVIRYQIMLRNSSVPGASESPTNY